ncbi:hypothetical protein U1Q18_017657 [Sarracenia purpurea var. burkii]
MKMCGDQWLIGTQWASRIAQGRGRAATGATPALGFLVDQSKLLDRHWFSVQAALIGESGVEAAEEEDGFRRMIWVFWRSGSRNLSGEASLMAVNLQAVLVKSQKITGDSDEGFSPVKPELQARRFQRRRAPSPAT